MIGDLQLLWAILSKKRKYSLILLLILTILSSIAEVVSIASLLPFLTIILSPNKSLEGNLFPFLSVIGFRDVGSYKLLITIFFVSVILLSNLIRILLLYFSAKISFTVGMEVGCYIFKNILDRNYYFFRTTSSSKIISALTSKIDMIVYGVINPLLSFVSSIIIAIPIIILLVILNPAASFLSIFFFMTIYFSIITLSRKKVLDNGTVMSIEATASVKLLQEATGSIRNVILDNLQNFFSDSYERSLKLLRKTQAFHVFFGQCPRYLVETLGIIFIAIFAYYLVESGRDSTYILTLIGVLALAAQRLLPVFQQIYSSWVSIHINKKVLSDISALVLDSDGFRLPIKQASANQPLKFEIDLRLMDVSYKWGPKSILQELNLTVPRGSKVGILGQTGSGKSTLFDILMGLLLPTSGSILVDGKALRESDLNSWYQIIAHVPQYIFLLDASIKNNIALGVPDNMVDIERVKMASRLANLDLYVQGLAEGYETPIGENGFNMSGGQRQRLAIARALYKEAEVIFFDEATSALDSETEEGIISTINLLAPKYTVFIIAHKQNILNDCDILLEVSAGKLVRKR